MSSIDFDALSAIANIKQKKQISALPFQENMRLFVMLESEPEEFHIYIYAKSYFYRFHRVAKYKIFYTEEKLQNKFYPKRSA